MTSTEERSARLVTYGLANHRALLLLHGLLLAEVGLAIFLFGGPLSAYEVFGEHSHVWLGIGGLIPGAVLLAGAYADPTRKSWAMKVFGLGGVVVWELFITWLFGRAVIENSGVADILGFGPELHPDTIGRPYVPLVYLNVALLALVHLITLIRLGPPEEH